MNIQTIFQAGNSQVVAIPREILSDMNLKAGDKVIVDKASADVLVIKKATKNTKTNKSAADFQKWLEAFMPENGAILDELAKR